MYIRPELISTPTIKNNVCCCICAVFGVTKLNRKIFLSYTQSDYDLTHIECERSRSEALGDSIYGCHYCFPQDWPSYKVNFEQVRPVDRILAIAGLIHFSFHE